MKKKKKNNNFYFISFIIVLIFFTTVIIMSYAKYVLDEKSEHDLNAERFYFKSNLLDINGKENNFFDWDLSSEYSIKFRISNYDDLLKVNGVDTKYRIEVLSNGVIPEVFINGEKKSENILKANEFKDDQIELKIASMARTEMNAELEIKAITEEPYEKIIYGTFNIGHAPAGESYVASIINKPGTDYSCLEIKTNSYIGSMRIDYDKNKVFPDINTTLLDNSEKHDGYIVINTKSDSNYEIKFIKKNVNDNITLGTDISVQ